MTPYTDAFMGDATGVTPIHVITVGFTTLPSHLARGLDGYGVNLGAAGSKGS